MINLFIIRYCHWLSIWIGPSVKLRGGYGSADPRTNLRRWRNSAKTGLRLFIESIHYEPTSLKIVNGPGNDEYGRKVEGLWENERRNSVGRGHVFFLKQRIRIVTQFMRRCITHSLVNTPQCLCLSKQSSENILFNTWLVSSLVEIKSCERTSVDRETYPSFAEINFSETISNRRSLA